MQASHEEMELILSEVDPDWRDKFYSATFAFNFYAEFRRPEMETMLLNFRREEQDKFLHAQRAMREFNDTLDNELRGIALLQRQAV